MITYNATQVQGASFKVGTAPEQWTAGDSKSIVGRIITKSASSTGANEYVTQQVTGSDSDGNEEFGDVTKTSTNSYSARIFEESHHNGAANYDAAYRDTTGLDTYSYSSTFDCSPALTHEDGKPAPSQYDESNSRGSDGETVEFGDTAATTKWDRSAGHTANGVADNTPSYAFGHLLPTHWEKTLTNTYRGLWYSVSTISMQGRAKVESYETTGMFGYTGWKTVTKAGTISNQKNWALSHGFTTNHSTFTSRKTKAGESGGTQYDCTSYVDDFLTQKTLPTVSTCDDTYTDSPPFHGSEYTYSIPGFSVITGHNFAGSNDTVFLMNAKQGGDDFNLGAILWTVKGGLDYNESSEGRFEEVFGSTVGATIIVPDYGVRFTTENAVTAITISRNTESMANPSTEADAEPMIVVEVISKNGKKWEGYVTCYTYNSKGEIINDYKGDPIIANSIPQSNIRKYTHSIQCGDIASGIISSNWTDWDGVAHEDTHTAYTHTIQVWGYDGNFDGYEGGAFWPSRWTSATTTAEFPGETGITEEADALMNSVITTITYNSRSTAVDVALISSFSLDHSAGHHILIGMVEKSTTRVFGVSSTTTCATYHHHFWTEVDQYTSYSSSAGYFHFPAESNANADGEMPQGMTYGGENGAGTTIEVSHSVNMTYYVESPVSPGAWTRPEFNTDNLSLGVARHQVHPFGYAGFAGGSSFDVSSIGVYFTVTEHLFDGSHFNSAMTSGIAGKCPMALACPGVSIFPVDENLPVTIAGAESARYLSGLNGIGVASLAVTWTTTTNATSGTGTVGTSRWATYLLAATEKINGKFFTDAEITFNSVGNRFQLGGFLQGGFGAGANAIGESYQVRCNGGFVRWGEVEEGDSVAGAIAETRSSGGTVTFAVDAGKAIVLTVEPIWSVSCPGGLGCFSSAHHQSPGNA